MAKSLRRALVIALALMLALGGLGSAPVQALPRGSVQQVMRAVVQIAAVQKNARGVVAPKWTGSGTIISKDGLILTNCHVAYPRAMWDLERWDYDALVVGLTTRSDSPPQFTYIAEVAQYDAELDLAVIRITRNIDGTPVQSAKLSLPPLDLGDSDALEIGDALSIFGYPGIGGDTITFTTGNVSGFSRERGTEGRAWVKTDATIAGGNSGGTAVNEDGELVAIPTQVGHGNASKAADCRPIQDTNGDGKIDGSDTCVTVGGFINALRPLALAQPLVQAAMKGLAAPPLPTKRPAAKVSTGKAAVSRLLYATDINENDQIVSVVHVFPAGTEDIYLFFDYDGFREGVVWQPVLIHGTETMTDVWTARTWSDVSSGTWWLGFHDDPIPDGVYAIALMYDGEQLGSASVKVGGPDPKAPTLSDIAFSGGDATGYLLPAGIDKLEATFGYANMTPDVEWESKWYQGGTLVAGGALEPFASAQGETGITLTANDGFEKGDYRLELYVEGKLGATSDFVIGAASQEENEPLFGSIAFGSELDADDAIANPATSFPRGIAKLYAEFDYQDMQDGWEWGRRWSIDDQVVVDVEDDWDGGESGQGYGLWLSGQGELPDGEYKLELSVRGHLVQTGEATVGQAAVVPTPTPRPKASTVEVQGFVLDADTGRGIPGALFMVLQPGITTDAFEWTDHQVYSMGEADVNGYYELGEPLVKGETYSMIIGAKGYSLVAEDGITVGTDIASPHRLDVKLQRSK